MKSPNVSVNNHRSYNEGQFLPEVESIMRKGIWDENVEYPWPYIRKIWLKYWDRRKTILLEKSPPNLVRAQEIERHFSNAFFIVFIRNPYAFCEGVIRRKIYTPRKATEFWVQCATHQKRNHELLESKLLIRYEDLVDFPAETCDLIVSKLSDLEKLQANLLFKVHNVDGVPTTLQNFNEKKISNLTEDQLCQINDVLKGEIKLLHYFSYQLIS